MNSKSVKPRLMRYGIENVPKVSLEVYCDFWNTLTNYEFINGEFYSLCCVEYPRFYAWRIYFSSYHRDILGYTSKIKYPGIIPSPNRENQLIFERYMNNIFPIDFQPFNTGIVSCLQGDHTAQLWSCDLKQIPSCEPKRKILESNDEKKLSRVRKYVEESDSETVAEEFEPKSKRRKTKRYDSKLKAPNSDEVIIEELRSVKTSRRLRVPRKRK